MCKYLPIFRLNVPILYVFLIQKGVPLNIHLFVRFYSFETMTNVKKKKKHIFLNTYRGKKIVRKLYETKLSN